MDGYAVRLGDFQGTGPWRFRVSERIIAGDTRPLILVEGTAERIFTGAPVPDGADAVIMQESVTRGSVIEVATPPHLGLCGRDHLSPDRGPALRKALLH
jgi:molybdopterin molybdotransferase